MEVSASVRSPRQAGAAVDVEIRERRLQGEEEGARADARRAMEELQGGDTLLVHGLREERLASFQSEIERVVAEVLRQERARNDLPGGRQRERSFDVLQVFLVGVIPDGQHSPKAVRQIVGDVIEPHLPAVPRPSREHSRRSIGHRARFGRRRLLGGENANGGRRVVDFVPLEEARGLGGGRPAELLPEAVGTVREQVHVRRQVRGAPRDPVVGQAEIGPVTGAVAQPRHEKARRAVLPGRPDQVRRVEQRHRSRAEGDFLHVGVVVERDRRVRESEGPVGLRDIAGGEDAVVDPVGGLPDLLDPLGDDVVVGSEVRGRVLEPAGLRLELERGAAAGHPGRPLIDDHVPLERRRLRREVVPPLVGTDLHVLVIDLHLFGPLPGDVLLVMDGLLRIEADLPPFFRDPELDLEVRPGLEARLEGVRVLGREERR